MIVKVGFDYEDDIEYMICPAKVGRNISDYKRKFGNGYITEKIIILIGLKRRKMEMLFMVFLTVQML